MSGLPGFERSEQPSSVALMQQFKREIRSAVGKQLAFDLRHGYGAMLSGLFERIGRGQRVYDSEIHETLGLRGAATIPGMRAGVAGPQLIQARSGRYQALVSLHGTAMYSVDYPPYAFSTLKLSQTMAQLAADPSIDTIILDIDTPGGQVTGTQEAADAVFAARSKKPVVGIVNPLCASAGYWIASQCSSIFAVPSADVGSIGVLMCHYDCSAMLANAGIKPTYIYAGEYKVEGNQSEPLGDEAKAWIQGEINKTYAQFLGAVARGRGTTVSNVKANFGGGRCFDAPAALKVGMIDAVSTLDVAVNRIASGALPARAAARAISSGDAGFDQIRSRLAHEQRENDLALAELSKPPMTEKQRRESESRKRKIDLARLT